MISSQKRKKTSLTKKTIKIAEEPPLPTKKRRQKTQTMPQNKTQKTALQEKKMTVKTGVLPPPPKNVNILKKRTLFKKKKKK